MAWQRDLRPRLLGLLKLTDLLEQEIPLDPEVISKQEPAVAVTDLSTQEKVGYTLEEVEINSTPGRRIRILVTRPRRPIVRPGVDPFSKSVLPADRAGLCESCHKIEYSARVLRTVSVEDFTGSAAALQRALGDVASVEAVAGSDHVYADVEELAALIADWQVLQDG